MLEILLVGLVVFFILDYLFIYKMWGNYLSMLPLFSRRKISLSQSFEVAEKIPSIGKEFGFVVRVDRESKKIFLRYSETRLFPAFIGIIEWKHDNNIAVKIKFRLSALVTLLFFLVFMPIQFAFFNDGSKRLDLSTFIVFYVLILVFFAVFYTLQKHKITRYLNHVIENISD